MLVPLTVGAAGPGACCTVGYPAVSALLCAAGLVTFAGVSAPRRAAAAWLLLLRLARGDDDQRRARRGHPVAGPRRRHDHGVPGMLASGTLALAADPGPRARAEEPTSAVPLAGVVVSYCLGFGVLLLLLASLAAGRPLVSRRGGHRRRPDGPDLARTLVWAADGARLTRQVLRTEAYFRTLVHRAADVTIVLDDRGQVTWAATADPRPRPGRRATSRAALRDLVHEDDRHDLHQALDPAADAGRRAGGLPAARPGRVVAAVRDRADGVSAGLPGSPRCRAVVRAARDGLVLHLRDVEGRRSTELELERLAYTDYLTGLPNRARLMAALTAAVPGRPRARAGLPPAARPRRLQAGQRHRRARGGGPPARRVRGAAAGDRARRGPRRPARRGRVRRPGARGHRGGDRAGRADRGRPRHGAPGCPIGRGIRRPDWSSTSRRASVWPSSDPEDDVSTTIRQADVALRAAKAAGKSCIPKADRAIDSAMGRRARLVRDLPTALGAGAVPRRLPAGGRAGRAADPGARALVRWDHPLLGTVPPDEFISLAEDDGLIVALQRWVLRRAHHRHREPVGRRMAACSSGSTCRCGTCRPAAWRRTSPAAPRRSRAWRPGRLMLEITESVMLDAEDRLESDLATLKGMGCILSVDDFGRGYSSLAYLARLPVDVLKMDREFFADIERDERAATLVASIVALGRSLGMDVVAEGVESVGQLRRAAQDMDCTVSSRAGCSAGRCAAGGAGAAALGVLRPERA